jgi:3-deoxy-D-manno-octulosonic-acid transferase
MTLYQGLAVTALRLGLGIIAPFSAKIRHRLAQEAPLWQQTSSQLVTDERRRLWCHAASMGELEQLLPIIERLRELRPDLCIVTTCTSPSGRDHAAKQKCIDYALYLPLDRQGAMSEFITTIDPLIVVIDRYDLWPAMISELHSRSVPIYLINATMPSSARWPLLRGFTRRMYQMVSHITAVSAEDASQLSTLIGKPVRWLPDTRLDRVMERIQRAADHVPSLPFWSGKTLVMGSTWPDDETMMLSAYTAIPRLDWRLIIVPHEPTEEALRSIEQRLPCRRLSKLANGTTSDSPHILVDSVGRLLELYSAATAAYVGGGFGAGVHSLAEPAGFGLALACGPRTERSRDAAELIGTDALCILNSVDQFKQWLLQIDDPGYRAAAQRAARDYVSRNTGSSDAYIKQILEALPNRT